MLIDETNWKQELAKLKARRVVVKDELTTLEVMWHNGREDVDVMRRATALWIELNDVLDKAIETIENVFVHKRCYI